jgi:hypothetical protein
MRRRGPGGRIGWEVEGEGSLIVGVGMEGGVGWRGGTEGRTSARG